MPFWFVKNKVYTTCSKTEIRLSELDIDHFLLDCDMPFKLSFYARKPITNHVNIPYSTVNQLKT